MASNDNGVTEAQTEEPKLNYFQKVWAYRKYLVIEPFFFFYLMASVFNAVAMQNFPLDKVCFLKINNIKENYLK